MGLNGISSLSIEALKILKQAEKVFIESYTNFLDPGVINELSQELRKPVQLLKRENLEQKEKEFLKLCENNQVALLVPGDPFIATTHVSLRLTAIKEGIDVGIIHAPSVFTAVPSLTGLSSYRFGKTATIGFQKSKYCYDVILGNLSIQAHTLLLLDIDVSSQKFLDVDMAIDQLQSLEIEYRNKIITEKRLMFGLARLGRKESIVHCGTMAELQENKWNKFGPPQTIVICSELQTYEEEAIQTIWGKENVERLSP